MILGSCLTSPYRSFASLRRKESGFLPHGAIVRTKSLHSQCTLCCALHTDHFHWNNLISSEEILEKYANLSPISPVFGQKKHYENELFSQSSFANQPKLTLNFHLPSDSWPELFPPPRVSSYSHSFLKASSRAVYSAKNLTILITELERHHSGYLWWVQLTACVDGAAPPPTGKRLTPGPALPESPALASLLHQPLPSPYSCPFPMCLVSQGGSPPASLSASYTLQLPEDCLPPSQDSEDMLGTRESFGVSEQIAVFPSLTMRKTEPHPRAPMSVTQITCSNLDIWIQSEYFFNYSSDFSKDNLGTIHP